MLRFNFNNGNLKIIERCLKLDINYLNDINIDVDSIESITIFDGIEIIDDYVFELCKNVKVVNLPPTLRKIGKRAFRGCVSLEKIVFPNGLEEIGEEAFCSCDNLKEVFIPKSVKDISESSFRKCDNLSSITIDSENRFYADYQSNAIVKISSAKLIYGCANSVISSKVKIIGKSAFYLNGKLENLVIPDGVEEIEDSAFDSCANLKEIILPQTLKKLGDYVFSNCQRLEVIDIPDNVLIIPKEAFSYCVSLKQVNLSENIFKISYGAFKNCFSLEKIDLPLSLEEIDDNAFINCANLKNLHIPRYVHSIRGNIVIGCVKLLSLTIDKENYYYSDLGMGVIFNNDKKSLISASCNLTSVPKDVKIIGKKAFAYSYYLNSIIIPDNVIEIEEEAFLQCINLEKVYISDNVKNIQAYAFFGCDKIKSFSLSFNTLLDPGNLDFASMGNMDVVLEVRLGDTTKNIMDIMREHRAGVLDYCYGKDGMVYILIQGVDRAVHVCLCDNAIVTLTSFIFIRSNSDRSEDLKYLHAKYYPRLAVWNRFALPHKCVIENMSIDKIPLYFSNCNQENWLRLLNSYQNLKDDEVTILFKVASALGVFSPRASTSILVTEYIIDDLCKKYTLDELGFFFSKFDIENTSFDFEFSNLFIRNFGRVKDFTTIIDRETGQEIEILYKIHNKFSLIKNFFPNNLFSLRNKYNEFELCLLKFIAIREMYKNVGEGLVVFSDEIIKYGYSQKDYLNLERCFALANRIEEEDLELVVCFDDVDERVFYNLLGKSNTMGAVLGNLTNCYQVINDIGKPCVEYGMKMPNSSFATFNIDKQFAAQSWVWYDKLNKQITFDNIVMLPEMIKKLNADHGIQEDFFKCLTRMAKNFVKTMSEKNLEVTQVTIGVGNYYNEFNKVIKKYHKSISNPKMLSDYLGYSGARKQVMLLDLTKNKKDS